MEETGPGGVGLTKERGGVAGWVLYRGRSGHARRWGGPNLGDPALFHDSLCSYEQEDHYFHLSDVIACTDTEGLCDREAINQSTDGFVPL